jgi:DNA-binding response OmpR family regulator
MPHENSLSPSAIPQAITPNPHTNLLNVYIYRLQIKWGFNPRKKLIQNKEGVGFSNQ